MSERASARAERPLNSLADIHLSDQTLDSVLGHIGRLALETMPGWDAVATTLIEGDKVTTYGITDERLNDLDQAQYNSGRGPCLDSFKSGSFQYYDGISDHPMWTKFAAAAADQGIYSVASFPLRLEGEMFGALNFYSEERDALRPGQREEAMLFAAQASVTLSNLRAYADKVTEVEQLEFGLETRTVIGQATGLLMAQEGLSSEEAFQKLAKVSQAANIKLREIAERFVDSWEEKKRVPRP
jgi:GAF domain-containing protein